MWDHFDGTVQFSASKKITDVQSQQPLPSLNGAGGGMGGAKQGCGSGRGEAEAGGWRPSGGQAACDWESRDRHNYAS